MCCLGPFLASTSNRHCVLNWYNIRFIYIRVQENVSICFWLFIHMYLNISLYIVILWFFIFICLTFMLNFCQVSMYSLFIDVVLTLSILLVNLHAPKLWKMVYTCHEYCWLHMNCLVLALNGTYYALYLQSKCWLEVSRLSLCKSRY